MEPLHHPVAATVARDRAACDAATRAARLVWDTAPGTAVARDLALLAPRLAGDVPLVEKRRFAWHHTTAVAPEEGP